VKTISRGGTYFRIAEPGWDDPLDASYSTRNGGRWNAAGSFAVCYLNRDIPTARANARHLLERRLDPLAMTVDDLDPDELPVLIETTVDADDFVDAVTTDGCLDIGLPASYPKGADGSTVPWPECQPIGQAAWDAGEPGIACRSAAAGAAADAEELAWFQRASRLVPTARSRFGAWYGAIDW
jgi:hypothetical protein